MLQERTFNIVIVGENNGTGIDISKPLKTIEYVGTQITQKFKYND